MVWLSSCCSSAKDYYTTTTAKQKLLQESMEEQEQNPYLKSILPYLPLHLRSSSLFWPPQVVEALKALSRGPHHSNVNSGQLLSLAISDLRNSLNYSSDSISTSALHGYSLFFDDVSPINWLTGIRILDSFITHLLLFHMGIIVLFM